ncbi:MAG: TrmH family RNA methyltransferase [Fodinibius sp.]|nr:TrmH family RNA methyltransferase [Fodinibius sp.]
MQGLFFDEEQQYWTQKSWQEAAADIAFRSLSSDLFAEVSGYRYPQGVLAICRMPKEATVDTLVSQKGIIVALDAVQDPGNLGTIIRTATWFGACGIISGKGTVDLFHPKVVRATAGATGSLPFINSKLEDILPAFEQKGWPTYFLDAG